MNHACAVPVHTDLDYFLERFTAAREHAEQAKPGKPLYVGIDSMALRRNAAVVKRRLQNAGLCAVLKGDAYGHGIENVVPAIRDYCSHYAVVDNWEAKAIKEHDPVTPIIRLRPASGPEIRHAIRAKLAIREHVGSLEQAKAVSRIAAEHHVTTDIHLSIDAGKLGRAGLPFHNAQKAFREVEAIASLQHVNLASIACHVPVLPQPCDSQASIEACDRLFAFERFVERVKSLPGLFATRPLEVSAFSSASSLAYSTVDLFRDMGVSVFHRIGNNLYGLASSAYFQESGVTQVMHACTRVCTTMWRPSGATVGYEGSYVVPQDGESLSLLGVGWLSLGRQYQGIGKTPSPAHVLGTTGSIHTVVGRQSMNISIVKTEGATQSLDRDDMVFITTAGECWPVPSDTLPTIRRLANDMGKVQAEYVSSMLGCNPSTLRFCF